MIATRRQLLTGLAAAALWALAPRPAAALTEEEAREFVRRVAAEVTELVQSGGSAQEQAKRFTGIFTRYADADQVARFVMGRTWRTMTEDQQARFRDAFVDYVGRVYASLLEDYEGQTLEVNGAKDFGQKGILVTSIARGAGVENSEVEWLISDRGGGGPKVIDITAEGVSLLQSQRQEFAAILDRRGGDVDAFISDLSSGGVSPPG
ncbi:MAG: MlaC/ttg2D family ABC transporter substrate-binding protein [Pseudomonadota bacterium]